MKTKSLLSTLALLVLDVSVGYAQRVETALVDGDPVINCEAMPAAAYTTTTKGNTEELLKTAAADKKVYKRFAVSNGDNSASSTWVSAFTLCSGISGGGWRLPTHGELALIWVLKRELESKSTKFADAYYWGATELDMDRSYTLYMERGTTSNNSKTNIKQAPRVRCIREL